MPLTIRNVGNQVAVATSLNRIVIDIRASVDNVYDSSDPLLTQIFLTSSLAAGASSVRSLVCKIPSAAIPGSYYAVASIDTSSVVAEIDDTNNAATTASPINVVWNFGAVTGRIGAIPLTLTDADGTKVTLKLTGPGTGTLTTSPDGYNISLANTTSATTFTVTTLKSTTPGDNGRFTLHNLTINGPIGSILAATTDISGNVSITNNATAITLGSLTNSAFSIGAPAIPPLSPPSVRLTFASLQDVTLSSAIGISTFTALNWLDTDANPDSLTAPFLTTLSVTGRLGTTLLPAIPGHFQPAFTLTGAPLPASLTLSTATIAGSVTNTAWDIHGKLGTVTIKGAVGLAGDPWFLTSVSSVAALKLGDVADASIAATGAITSLTALRFADGDISAASLATLSITGRAKTTLLDAIPGNFGANLTLSGNALPTAATLGTATIAGSVPACYWEITGSIGALTINGTVGTDVDSFKLTHVTNIATLTLGDVVDAYIIPTGNITTLKSQRWQAGTLAAKTIATLSITGRAATALLSAIPGNFFANVTLSGAALPTANTLTAATIAGNVGSHDWLVTGKLGTLTINGSVGIDDSTWSIQNLTSSGALKFADVANATISASGAITSITAQRFLAGSISAATLGSLTTTGRLATLLLPSLTGDFAADLTLTGPLLPTLSTLGLATIAGRLGPATWDITGKSGRITAATFDPAFAANITGALAGITAKSALSGNIAAKSIGTILAPSITGATLLAGADLGSDAALGGAASAADTFAPGFITSLTVTGAITNSTILAGIHPYDDKFNDLNDVALGGKASYIGPISAASINAASRLDAALLPATARIAALPVSTKTDPRFHQNNYVLTSAGVTDSTGTVTFAIGGLAHTYQFLDEATQLPLANAPASLVVDAETFSFGLITLLCLGRRVPLQFISLSGTNEPAVQPLALSALAVPAVGADPETISVDLGTDLTTKTLTDLGTPWLTKLALSNFDAAAREAANKTVGILASAFVSIVNIGLQGLDNVSHGASSDYLAKLPFAESKVTTAAIAQQEIATGRATDIAGTIIYSTMMSTIDPLAPVATAIDLSADGVQWATCNAAYNARYGVRVTNLGPFKIVSYAPLTFEDRLALDGNVLVHAAQSIGAPEGGVELISKSVPGESYYADFDAAGNATIPAPHGDYRLIAHVPGYSATIDDFTASAGPNPLDLVLDPAPVPGFTIAPTTTLQTSESGTTATFAVSLNTAPTANVTLTLVNSDPTETKLSKTSLIFTPANWATPQTVIVTGVNDSLTDGNIPCAIITNPATSTDPNYSALNPDDISVVNADNEASATPIVTFDSLVIAERETRTYDGGMFTGIVTEERYRLTGTATASGPVNTYIDSYPGFVAGSFVMNGWTGNFGNYYFRAPGDPASTTFSFDVYTHWVSVSSGTPDLTVYADASYYDPTPSLLSRDSITMSFP